MSLNKKFFIVICLLAYLIMENSFSSTKFVNNPSERQTLLEKRLVSIDSQIQWLEKIKRTLEHQLTLEKQKNFS